MADTPVVCLLGPRQSGKTTLARQLAPRRTFVSLDEPSYYRTATDIQGDALGSCACASASELSMATDPAGLVASLPEAATVDEVQRVPALLPVIKHAVDRDRRPGRFLLTGSANLLLTPAVTESLAGRMEIVQLHPLTESEKERRPGGILNALLAGALEPGIRPREESSGPSLAERLVAGGYPEPFARTPRRARQWHRQYLRSIIERDMRDVARVRDVNGIGRLLELLALRSAELFNASGLANDLGLRRETVEHYVAVLERLFLVRRLPAWRRNPANRLVASPKVHFLDSGLAATLGGLTADHWLSGRDRMGHLLESFVVQQIVAQAAWTDPDLRFWHYRTATRTEWRWTWSWRAARRRGASRSRPASPSDRAMDGASAGSRIVAATISNPACCSTPAAMCCRSSATGACSPCR